MARAVIPMANILVVDDVHDAADAFAELLTLFGHEVRVAYSAAQALSEIDQSAPDVVLADIDMPLIDGLHLARRIRARWGRGIRLVAHTDAARADVISDVSAAGFDAYVSKSARPLQLALAVRGRRGTNDLRSAKPDRRRARRAGTHPRRSTDRSRTSMLTGS